MSGPDCGGGDMSERATLAKSAAIEGLPEELLEEILSRLSWREQLRVRSVSRLWQAAVDACLARRQDLEVDIEDSSVLDKVINLLQNTPALRCLGISTSQLACALFSGTVFGGGLDPAAMGMICSACPFLQEVHLNYGLKEDTVRTLLSRLPGLRVLHLPVFRIKGDMLSLLPAGLQSLTLHSSDNREPALFRSLTRYPQLRELKLTEVSLEDLEAALAACPQLDRLSLGHPLSAVFGRSQLSSGHSDWTSMLPLCPQLRELKANGRDVDLFTVLTACGRLERLTFWNTCVNLPPSAHLYKFGLTQLVLTSIDDVIDDATFCRLARLLPGLTHLNLYTGGLTEEALAGGLQCLADLQVLELSRETPLSPTGPMLDSLSGLPLKAFSFRPDFPDASVASFMAALLRCCPTLTALSLPFLMPDSMWSFLDELGIDALEHSLTLVLHEGLPSDTARLPRNIRVLEHQACAWAELTGWGQWGLCRFCHD